MRTLLVLMLVTAAAGAHADSNTSSTSSSNSSSSSNSDAERARAAAAAAQQQRRMLEDAQHVSQLGLDPTRIRTIGVWPGKTTPCKLPKRDEPYSCRRLIEGPAMILSRISQLELIVARGDEALGRGERSWWLHTVEPVAAPVPIAIGAGEVLYVVGDLGFAYRDSDLVVTVYR